MRIYAVFALFGAAAWAQDEGPMFTVLEELQKLKKTIQGEMEEETKIYEDYACFCKDTTDEKGLLLEDLNEDKTAQEETIEENAGIQSNMRFAINSPLVDAGTANVHGGNLAMIKYLEEKIAQDDKDEAAAAASHTAEAEHLQKAIVACRKAIEALHKGAGVAMLQMPMVKEALALGDAMGIKKASSLLQQPAVPLAATSAAGTDGVEQDLGYGDKAKEVIEIVEGLQQSFKEELQTQTEARLAAQKAYAEEKQTDTQALVTERNTLKQNENTLAAATETLKQTQRDYTQTTKQIDQARVYLNDLSNKCAEAKAVYDERAMISLEELRMMSMVHALLDEKAKTYYDTSRQYGEFTNRTDGSESDQRAVQDGQMGDCEAVHEEWYHGKPQNNPVAGWTPSSLIQRKPMTASKPSKALPSLLETFAAAPAFLQRRMEKTVRPHNEVADILRASAEKIGSPTLAALATKVDSMAPGVFDRVNALIRQLITRLQDEQAKDIAHHGYCESQMAEMKQARDTAKTNMDNAQAAGNKHYARAELLRAAINDLQHDNYEIQKQWKEAHLIMTCEVHQNDQMIYESKNGRAAVEKAIELIGTLQQNITDMNSGSTNTQNKDGNAGDEDTAEQMELKGTQEGRQEQWRTITVLLDTMKDQLQKSEDDAAAATKEAKASYQQFASDCKSDMEAKHATRAQKIRDRDHTVTKLNDANTRYTDELASLNSALELWENLRQSCQSEGVSPAERAAKRQAEIKALKEALEVLNQVTAH